jgi:hypothetical protein
MKAGDKLYCIKDFYRAYNTFYKNNWYEIKLLSQYGHVVHIYCIKSNNISERVLTSAINIHFITEKESRKLKLNNLNK